MGKEIETGEKKKIKRQVRPLDILILLVFLVGLSVMLYPMASDFINRLQVAKILKIYRQDVGHMATEDYTAIFEKARDYNRRLKKNP
ncbi:MAG: class C sortase, partial [Lachnospiraceae bacterium]|nr:class C sortase [Lachnospiraceae bacterium]